MDRLPFRGAEETCASVFARVSGPSLAKRHHLESGNEAHPSGRKSAGGNVSTNSTNTRKKEVCGGWHSGGTAGGNVSTNSTNTRKKEVCGGWHS